MEGFEQKAREYARKWMDDRHGSLRKCIFSLLAGVCLLIILWPETEQKTEDASSQQDEAEAADETDTDGSGGMLSGDETQEDYISSLENRLKQMLENVKGVGTVEVMITLSDSGERIVEKDVTSSASQSDTDSQTTNSETSVMTQASGGDDPYVSKVLEPEIEGVFVTCEGASDPEIVVRITEAVQALFDVPAHKIVVLEQE